MIPIRVVHVAREQLYEMGLKRPNHTCSRSFWTSQMSGDEALGAIRSHINTYELRKLLGVEE